MTVAVFLYIIDGKNIQDHRDLLNVVRKQREKFRRQRDVLYDNFCTCISAEELKKVLGEIRRERAKL